MDNKHFWNSKKNIIIIISLIVVTGLSIFIFNKIRVVPGRYVLELPQPRLQLQRFQTSTSSPIEEAVLSDGSVTIPTETVLPIKDEYPKQVIVSLKSWSDTESAKEIIIKNGGRVIKVLNWPTKNVIIASLPNKNAEEGILKNSFWGKLVGGIGLSSFGNKLTGGIDRLEKDTEVQTNTQLTDWGVTQVKANQVWGMTGGNKGAGVKIAILDTGVQKDHPDLIANIKGGINFTDTSTTTVTVSDTCYYGESDQTDPYECNVEIVIGVVDPNKWDDDRGHGTKMAGIIAAEDNNIGVVGVAPEADLYIIKALGGDNSVGSRSDVISGIYWAADNGMDILNMSIGSNNYSEEEAIAVNYAYQRDVLLVGSSGNDGLAGLSVNYPAAYPSVIAVGAVGSDNQRSAFSSYGPEVELAAPGDGVITTVMGSTYDVGRGTSDAAPFVSGVAALIKSKNPTWTPAQIRNLLNSTAIDLGAPGRDIEYGYGLVNSLDSIITRPDTTITLVSPIGGEQWLKGVQHEIVWGSDNLTIGDTVDIQLINQATGITYPIISNLVNTGRVTLNIPPDQPESDNYVVQVSCPKHYQQLCQSAISGSFKIVSAPSQQALQILSPNGGERLPQGTSQSVAWKANYFGGSNVDITLLESKQLPKYSLKSQSGNWNNIIYERFDNYLAEDGTIIPLEYFAWDYTQDQSSGGRSGYWTKELPKDTCDGNIGTDINNGIFVCPATSLTTGAFNCIDIAQSKKPLDYFERTVTCEYNNTDIGTSAPVYSLVAGSQVRTPYNPNSGKIYGAPWFADMVGFKYIKDGYVYANVNSPVPPDTCNGDYSTWTYPSIASTCPATNNSEHLRCVDIWRNTSGTYFEGYVDCSYTQTGTVNEPAVIREVPVAVGQNIANTGLAKIDLPSDISGNRYRVKLTCSNFNGTCSEGLSAAPFSIINLTDPKVLTINKSGIGAVTDGNISCGIDRDICLENYENGSTVNLYVATTSNPNLIFNGWSGACTGTDACRITMNSDKSVTANFSNKLCNDYLTAPRDLVVEQNSTDYGLKFSWKAPGSNGGSEIIGYTIDKYFGPQGVSCENLSNNDLTNSFTGMLVAAQPTYITDSLDLLQSNTCYVFSIKAKNMAGSISSPAEKRYFNIKQSRVGPFTLTGAGFKSGLFGGVEVYHYDASDNKKITLGCDGWAVNTDTEIGGGYCDIPYITPIGGWNVRVKIGNKFAELKPGLTISPPALDKKPNNISFEPKTVSVSSDNKIYINSILGNNIRSGASVTLVNKNNPTQQIPCFNISQQIGRENGLVKIKGPNCDTSNIGFVIPPPPAETFWDVVIHNTVQTNNFTGTSTIPLSTKCDPVDNCSGKECGSDGCGGFCKDSNGNSGTVSYYSDITNIKSITRSCSAGSWGISTDPSCVKTGTQSCDLASGKYDISCAAPFNIDPRENNCTNTDGTIKECGSDQCGGLCGGGPITTSCVKPNAFGTCNGDGIKTCNNGTYGSCAVTQTDPRIANCAGRQCGLDQCGGTCGNLDGKCSNGQVCDTTNGICIGKKI